MTSSDSHAWYLTRFSGECVGAVGAYTLKIVTYFFSLPLVLPDPRNMDWMEPVLSLVPPQICTFDSLSAENARP